MVDGDFHSLPRRGFTAISGPFSHPGPPQCLEFRCWASSSRGGISHWSLRIPIAPGAEALARTVYDHYVARFPQPKPRSPRFLRLLRNTAALIALTSGAAFGAGMWVVENKPELKDEWGIALMITLIVSIMVCIGSTIIALVAHVRGMRVK